MNRVEGEPIEVSNCGGLPVHKLVIPEDRESSIFTEPCSDRQLRPQNFIKRSFRRVRGILGQNDPEGDPVFYIERDGGNQDNPPELLCSCTGCIYNQPILKPRSFSHK